MPGPSGRSLPLHPAPGVADHALGVVARGAPARRSAVSPSARSPASRMHDFTWAEATASSWRMPRRAASADGDGRQRVVLAARRPWPPWPRSGSQHPGHGPAADAGVAGEHAEEGQRSHQAGQQADERAGVAHVDDVVGLAQPSQPGPWTTRSAPVLVHLHAQRPHGGDGRQGVGRAQEAGDPHRPVVHRAQAGPRDARPTCRRARGPCRAGPAAAGRNRTRRPRLGAGASLTGCPP